MSSPERRTGPTSTGTRQTPPMPEFYMPAMWPVELTSALAEWFRAWRRRRRFRRLLDLDDRLLADIGYSREDILWGIRLPLRENAARAATERSRARHRRSGRAGV